VTALVSQRQWARALGVCTATFRRWREAGLIPVPLDLPGHPRWDAAVVASVTKQIRAAGTSRFFRTAAKVRVSHKPLQPRTSRSKQSQRTLNAAHFTGQPVGDVCHAGSVGAAATPEHCNSIAGPR
jgi:hypothetical protein